jgi:hypothetical protein
LAPHWAVSSGVVVIESGDLLHARLKASPAGADRGLEFAFGHQLDPVSAEQIPANMIGRFLDEGDLQRLHRMLIKKKPPAPSVRRGTALLAEMVRASQELHVERNNVISTGFC